MGVDVRIRVYRNWSEDRGWGAVRDRHPLPFNHSFGAGRRSVTGQHASAASGIRADTQTGREHKVSSSTLSVNRTEASPLLSQYASQVEVAGDGGDSGGDGGDGGGGAGTGSRCRPYSCDAG